MSEGSTGATALFDIYTYLNQAVFTSLLLLFALWRSARSTLPSFNIFKGKLRSLGTLFMISSIFFSTLFDCLIAYLSQKIELDKSDIELSGKMDSNYIVTIRNNNIDLVRLVNMSMVMSKVLRVSGIYLLIGLWAPCAYSAFHNRNRAFSIFGPSSTSKVIITKSIFNTSIITFAKIYAFARTICMFFFYFKTNFVSDKTVIFFESFFLAAEIYLAVALLIILRTKHSFLSEHRSLESTNLLCLCLMMHGFFAYTINTIAIPFDLSNVQIQILQSVGYAAKLTLDMLIISMFCPIRDQLFDYSQEKFKESNEIERISRIDCSTEHMIKRAEEVVVEVDEREEGK